MQYKKQQLELGMEQPTGSKLGREYDTLLILAPCLSNFYSEYIMQNAVLHVLQAEIKIAGRNINNLRYEDGTIPMTEVNKNLKKKPIDEGKREEWEASLKLNIKKLRLWHPVPSLHAK